MFKLKITGARIHHALVALSADLASRLLSPFGVGHIRLSLPTLGTLGRDLPTDSH